MISSKHHDHHAMVLELTNITKNFGGVTAVSEFSLAVPKNCIIGLVGPNGSGKTTVFNLIAGVLPPSGGLINYQDITINRWPPHKRAKYGIARTFQNIRLFRNLTVLENMLIGSHCRFEGSFRYIPDSLSFDKKRKETILSHAIDLLHYLGLESKMYAVASSLPYGEQRKLEIGRAFMSRPRLLLLDEPTAGMNLEEASSLMKTVQTLKEEEGEELSIIIIEHNMNVVMSVCNKVTVLNAGRKIAEGTPDEIRGDAEVIRVYLGD